MTFASTGQTFQDIDVSNYTPNLVAYQMVFSTCLIPKTKDQLIASAAFCSQWWALSWNTLVSGMYKVTHVGTQVAQLDFQNKASRVSLLWRAFVLEVPLSNYVTGSYKGPVFRWRGKVVRNALHIIEWVLDLSTISIHNFRPAGRVSSKEFLLPPLEIGISCHFFYTSRWQFLH